MQKTINRSGGRNMAHRIITEATPRDKTFHCCQLGQLMVEARRKQGIDREELAKRLNLCTQYLEAIENGESQPSTDMCGQIARKLRLNPDHVMLAAGHAPVDVLLILRAYPHLCETLRRLKLNYSGFN
ncbi:XRE family transcriptional regulator [bacterium]|nr:MAG: XRE family transcriptional regulator [bacterium]